MQVFTSIRPKTASNSHKNAPNLSERGKGETPMKQETILLLRIKQITKLFIF
jgi:hypothetical protein